MDTPCMQLGDLGVLQGVVRGFSEEARIRGFPFPSFGGFGFVRCDQALCGNRKIASIRGYTYCYIMSPRLWSR